MATYLVAIVVTSPTASALATESALGVRFSVCHNPGDPRGKRTWSVMQCRLESPAPKDAPLDARLTAVLDLWPADWAARLRSAGLTCAASLDVAVLTPDYTHTLTIPATLLERAGRMGLTLDLVYYPTDG